MRECDAIDSVNAEIESLKSTLDEYTETLGIIQSTMSLLTEACESMTARYIGKTREGFLKYENAIGGDGGVDDAAGGVDPGVTVVAQVVGEGVLPGLAIVLGHGNNGIQTAGVVDAVPAGVTDGDQGAVVQGDDAGDAEVGASAGTSQEGLTLGGSIVGLLGDGQRQGAHRQNAQQHAQSQHKGQGAFEFIHTHSPFSYL